MGNLYSVGFEKFGLFVNELVKSSNVYGPVKTSVTKYELLTDASELYFDTLVEYGAKGLFFKPGELMYKYQKDKVIPAEFPKQKRKVLLGLRLCDLAAIKKQDIAFGASPTDPYYAWRRDNTLLFGYHQKQCGDEWCFCQSIDLDVSFDLMFYKRTDHYLVEIGSERGTKVIEEFPQFFDKSDYVMTADDRKIDNQLKLDSVQIDDIYSSHEWQKLADECFSCGVCNVLCPTCFCFEFKDKKEENGDGFERTREQSECQVESFTRVAGDHVFRDKKVDRFKHRIYHQLQYFKDKFGKTLCVGCGRCMRSCPTKIDFVTGINEMKIKRHEVIQ